jgi:hypothetical protein
VETTSFDWDQAHVAAIVKAIILYLDTGATSSICPILKYFTKIIPCNHNVSGVGGSSIKAVGIGEIRVRIGKGRHFTLKDVLYCPDAAVTLISVGKLCDDGHTAIFSDHGCSIRRLSGKIVATGSRAGTGLYTLDCDKAMFTLSTSSEQDLARSAVARAARAVTANIAIKAVPTLETWHRRLGHVNIGTVLDMARRHAVTGMDADLSHIPAKCADCILGKQKKKPVRKKRKGPRSTRKLQKVFADLAGPQAVAARGGYLYTLQLIDDCTHEQ